MKQFVNPVFTPLNYSHSYQRSGIMEQAPRTSHVGQDYEKIFSSETDLSQRLNDSLFRTFENVEPSYRRESGNDNLSITQVVDQKRFNNEILRGDDSLCNSSILNFLSTNDHQKNLRQMDSLYRKLEDISMQSHQRQVTQTESPRKQIELKYNSAQKNPLPPPSNFQISPKKQLPHKPNATKPCTLTQHVSQPPRQFPTTMEVPREQQRSLPKQMSARFSSTVVCVICEQSIRMEDLDAHSALCLQKTRLLQNQNTKAIQEINQKLEQVLKAIDHQNRPMIQQLIITEDSKRLTQLTEQLQQQFNQMQSQFDQKKFYILLLLQRGLSLAQEKCLKLQFIQHSNNSTDDTLLDELSLLERQAQQEKKYVSEMQSKLMEQIQKEDQKNMQYLRSEYLKRQEQDLLSQINSEDKKEIISQKQISHSVVSDAIKSEHSIRTMDPKQEDLKKKFYNIAVQIKLYLPHNHPGKNQLISDLYDLAMLQRIPMHQWQNFITQKLS